MFKGAWSRHELVLMPPYQLCMMLERSAFHSVKAHVEVNICVSHLAAGRDEGMILALLRNARRAEFHWNQSVNDYSQEYSLLKSGDRYQFIIRRPETIYFRLNQKYLWIMGTVRPMRVSASQFHLFTILVTWFVVSSSHHRDCLGQRPLSFPCLDSSVTVNMPTR